MAQLSPLGWLLKASPHGFKLGVPTSGDVSHRRHDQDVRLQAGIRSIAIRKLSYERRVEFKPGLGQPQEKEHSAVDPALVATGGLTDECTQAVLPDGLRKLEGRRAVRGANQDPQLPRKAGGDGSDDSPGVRVGRRIRLCEICQF